MPVNISNFFVGKLYAFETKNDTTNVEDQIICELTEATKDGYVEIAFNDRNERVYVSFKLGDMLTALLAVRGGE